LSTEENFYIIYSHLKLRW